MADRIKGITIEIGGDTTGLNKALQGVNSEIRSTQSQLKDVERLLKLDPTNTELLKQKQKLLAEAVGETKNKLDTLKEANRQAAESASNYDAWKEKYDPIKQKIDETKKKLAELKTQSKEADEQLANGEISQEKYDALQAEIKDTSKELRTLQKSARDVADEFGNPISPEQYDALQREIAETEQQLKKLEEQAQKSNVALQKIGQAGESVKEFGSKATSAGKAMMPVTAAIAGAGAAAVKSADDMKSAVNTYLSATGDYKEGTEEAVLAAEQFEEIFSEIYKNNYGESLDDIAQSAAVVKANMRDIPTEGLQKATESAILLRDVFGYDVTESTRAANTMMQQFGISSDEAFNLIAQGAQNGLDYSGELLDSINEYSVQFKKVGLDADDMFNIFSSGAKNGAFNLDKIGDAVKELSIRVVDGSDATVQGFEAAGLSAEDMAKEFGKGGESAKKAFKETINALKKMEDPLERNTAGVNLFGTMWEDLGETVVLSMADSEEAIDSTTDAIGRLKEQKYDDLKNELASIGRIVVSDVVIPLGQELIPMIKDVVAALKVLVSGFSELSPGAQKAIIAIGLVVAAIGPLLIAIGQISTGVGSLMTMISTIGPAIGALGAAGGPIALVTGAVVALGVAFIAAKKETVDYYTEAAQLSEAELENKAAVESLAESYNSLAERREVAVSQIESQAQKENDLWKELQNIVDENGRVKEGYEDRAAFITSTLSDALGQEISITGGVIQNYKDLQTEIAGLIEQKRAEATLGAFQNEYAEAVANTKKAQGELAEATANAKTATDAYNEAVAKQNELQEEQARIMHAYMNDTSNNELGNRYYELQEQIDVTSETIAGLKAHMDENNLTMENARLAVESYNATIANYEGASAAIISGDQEKISAALWLLQNDFKTTETATRESLEAQNLAIQTELANAKAAFEQGSPNITQAYIDGLAQLAVKAQAELDKLPAQTNQSMLQIQTEMETAGSNATAGYVTGLTSGVPMVEEAAGQMVDSSVNAVKTALDSHSPSRVTEDIGRNGFDAGLAQGIAEGADQVTDAVLLVTEAATESLKNNLDLSQTDFSAFQNTTKTDWTAWAAELAATLREYLTQINSDTTSNLQKMQATVTLYLGNIKNEWKRQLLEIRKEHESNMDAVSLKTTETFTAMADTVQVQTEQMVMDSKNAMNELVAGVAEELDELEPTIRGGFEPGVEYITSLIDEARTWGNHMMQELIQGLEDYLDELEDVCEDIADTISDNLHFTRPERGSLRNYEEWMPHFMQGLAKGIADNKYLVSDQIQQLADDMAILKDAENAKPTINFTNRSILVLDGEQVAETVDTYLGGAYG